MLADRPDGHRLSAEEQRQLDDLEWRLKHGPMATPRLVPVGLAATRPRPGRGLLIAFLAVPGGALLVLAAIVGGLGGAAATVTALLATLSVCRLLRLHRPPLPPAG